MTETLELLEEPQSLGELQMEIGKWSRHNFGTNQSQLLPGSPALHQTCPLMGMSEELGELFDAQNREEEEDAVADICIYLLDYCTRCCMKLEPLVREAHSYSKDERVGLVSCIGKLHRIELKAHQGIRGYSDHNKVKEDRKVVIVQLYHYLQGFAHKEFESSVFDLAAGVWTKIVSKRDWVNKPATAGN